MVGIKRVVYTTDDGYVIEKGSMIDNDHISRIEQLNIENMKLCLIKE